MLHMNTPPTPKVHKQLRVTVPITPEVLALFQRFSAVSGKSVGKLMGEWLDETREGLEPMIEIMTNFKKAPKAAVQAIQLHANALTEMAEKVVQDAMSFEPERVAKMHRLQRSEAGADLATDSALFTGKRGLTPPSSNTGGKGRGIRKNSMGGVN